jgi:hypothetical protein
MILSSDPVCSAYHHVVERYTYDDVDPIPIPLGGCTASRFLMSA